MSKRAREHEGYRRDDREQSPQSHSHRRGSGGVRENYHHSRYYRNRSSTFPSVASASTSSSSSTVRPSPSSATEAQQQPSSMQQRNADQALQLVPASSKHYKPPARPGFGTLGTKCVVKANHFLVDLGNRDPYQYDVTISPDVTSKTKCRQIMKCLTRQYTEQLGNRRLAYDGKNNAFVAGQLPFDYKEFVITVPKNDGRDCEFKVTVKFVARKNIDHLRWFLRGRENDNAQETIQTLDVVLRHSALKGREEIGRSIYSVEFGNDSLTGGMEYWRGFYQSLRHTQMGLSLNIDISARPFFEPIFVSDFVKKLLNKDVTRPLSEQERNKVKKALIGVKVEVVHGKNRRSYKIHGITTQTTNQLSFPYNGTTIFVVQYYHERYNHTVQFPYLPAIRAGAEERPMHLPMEVQTC